MSKKVTGIIGAIVVLVVVGILFMQLSKKQSQVGGAGGDTPTPSVTQSQGTDSTSNSSTAGTYTMAQVATHATASDCWTTINGGVYNVTSWIKQHPGGQEAILSLCGTDGSAAFDGQHGGDRRPTNELASFKIGTLGK